LENLVSLGQLSKKRGPMNETLNPQALPPDAVARVLSAASGQPILQSTVEADIADGAPTNADGTLSLVHYAAWLVREMGRGQ
jgi:hypothetical protein